MNKSDGDSLAIWEMKIPRKIFDQVNKWRMEDLRQSGVDGTA